MSEDGSGTPGAGAARAAFPALPLAAARAVISFPRTGFPGRMIPWSGLTQEFCVRLKGAGSGQEFPHVCKRVTRDREEGSVQGMV